MRTRLLLGLLAIGLLGGACGGDAPDEGSPSTGTASPWPFQAETGSDAPITLPDARRGLPDSDGEPRRWILNVLPSGDVVLKGHMWRLASEDETDRKASAAGLRAQLVSLEEGDRARGATLPAPVLIVADRSAPWAAIRRALAVLREPEIGTRRIAWAIRRADGADGRVDGRVEADDASPGQPLVLRIVPDRTEAWTAVRIFSPSGIHSFGPQSKAYANEKFLRRANTTWDALARVLPALADEHEGVHLEVLDEQADVWFAYVVTAVDLLFGAGYAEVRLPQVDLVMVRPADGA